MLQVWGLMAIPCLLHPPTLAGNRIGEREEGSRGEDSQPPTVCRDPKAEWAEDQEGRWSGRLPGLACAPTTLIVFDAGAALGSKHH